MVRERFKNLNLFVKTLVLTFFCFALLFSVSLNFSSYKQEKVSYALSNEQAYSQEYLKYLSLSEEEKKSYGVIPRMYDVDISSLYSSSSYQALQNSSSLPTEFSLYKTTRITNNFDYENRSNFAQLPKNVGNQKSVNICWTFSTLTSLESTLYRTGVVDTSTQLNFSELNLAYNAQVVNHGLQTIGGGTFDWAYEYLSYELGPVNEQENEASLFVSSSNADSEAQNNYVENYLNSASKAGYSALEAFSYPKRSSCANLQEVTDLRNTIKNHIYTYGAVTASIAYDDSYYNSNSKYFCNTSSTDIPNHLITLVGWDDNFRVGDIMVGAYIAQNSWGTQWGDEGYFYIMYSDAKVEDNVSGFVRVGESLTNSISYNNFEDTIYENNYISYSGSATYYNYVNFNTSAVFANFFEASNVAGQYFSRIKIPTIMPNNQSSEEFYVYVFDNMSYADVASNGAINSYLTNNFSSAKRIKNVNATTSDEYLFSSNQVGLYSIDVNQLIVISGDYYAVLVKYVSGSVYLRDNVDLAFSSVVSNKRTYYSLNPTTSWNYFDINVNSQQVKENLPMLVQTEYMLNDISYTVSNVLKTYDGLNASFDVNVSNIEQGKYSIYYSLNGVDFSSTLNLKDAGSYKVYYKIVADFYNTVVGDDKFFMVDISRKPLTVTPVEDYKIYGNNDILDYIYSGYISGETPKIYGYLTREPGEDVGFYEISYNPSNFYLQDKGAFKASNYQINFTQGVEYEIRPRVIDVIFEDSSKVYGSEDPTAFNIILTGAINNQVPNCTGQLTREEGENVGDYSLVSSVSNPLTLVDNGSFKATNYVLNLNASNKAFHITKKQIVVTPDSNLRKVFGTEDPTLTFSHSGEVNGEVASFYGELSRTPGENVGQYEIIFNEQDFYLINNNSFLANNYYISLTSGVMFSIDYGSLSGCQFESASYTYDGQNHYLIAYSQNPNTSITYSLEQNGTYSSNLILFKDVNLNGQEVSPYTVYAKFESPNYNSVVLSATLTINKANLVVTPLEGQSKVYNGLSKVEIAFNYTGCPQDEEPNFSGSLTCQNLTKDVGDYLIVDGSLQIENSQTFNKNNYNYVFDNHEEIKFSIVKKAITICPNQNQYKYFGQEDGELTYQIVGLVDDENPTCQGYLTRENGENANEYLILIGSLSLQNSSSFDLDNYTVNFANVNYTIRKSNITVKIENVEILYGETPEFSYSILDEDVSDGTYRLGDNLNVTYVCEVNSQTKKNDPNIDYTIYGFANNANYNIEIINGVCSILYNVYEVKFQILPTMDPIVVEGGVEHFSYVLSSQMPSSSQINIAGYNFNFWQIEIFDEFGQPTGSYKEFVYNQDYIERDTTIIANIIAIRYTAKFFTNSEQETLDDVSFTVTNPTYTLPTNLHKTGYTFVNWFNNPSFTGSPVYEIPTGTVGNKNFYAKWQINLYNVVLPVDEEKFTIQFNTSLQNGSDIQVEYNSSFVFKVVLKSPYTKSSLVVSYNSSSNLNFIELQKNSDNLYSINAIDSDVNISVSNITTNTYKVKFIIDGQVNKTITKTHGESVLASEYPALPEKTNYNMVAPTWDKTNVNSVEEDLNIKSVYTPNVYNITFVVSDGNVYQTTLVYGQTVSDEILQQNYNLNMFEYFDFDSNLFGIDRDTTINVTIKSNIYILYIVLASVGAVLVLTVIALVLRKKSKSKLKWWAYVKNPDKTIKK